MENAAIAHVPRRRPRKEGASKFLGVRIRGPGKFGAEITIPKKNKRKWLGTFPTEEEAAHAYDRAARSFGFEEWRCNFPKEEESSGQEGESGEQKKSEVVEQPSESSGSGEKEKQLPLEINLNCPPPLV